MEGTESKNSVLQKSRHYNIIKVEKQRAGTEAENVGTGARSVFGMS